VVATTPYAVDDYVSFVLDTPYEVEEDDTAKARVYADILDGAGDTIIFSVESDLDVHVIDQDVKQPARVTAEALATGSVTVEAGELTVVGYDASFDEFGQNVDNMILGYVDITSDKGESIELKNINLNVASVGGNIDTALDVNTFEAVTSNGTYDLSGNCVGQAACTVSASNIDLRIESTERVWFRVDSLENGFNGGRDITISLQDMNGDVTDGLYFEEENDGDAITDITPTNVSFETITSAESSLTVRAKAQSSTQTIVQGSDDIIAMHFELEAGDASYVDVDDITFAVAFEDAAAGGNATVDDTEWDAGSFASSDHIDVARLYHTSIDEANLIDSEGGSEIAGGLLELNLNDFRIAAGATTEFFLVVNINDNDDIDGDFVKVAIDSMTSRDSENDTVTELNSAGNNLDETDVADGINGADAEFDDTDMELSRRQLNLVGSGELNGSMDNTDSLTDRDINILAGTEAVVASVELTAVNESLTIEDFIININEGAQNAEDLYSSVKLLDSNLELLAEETVSSNTVTFNNADVPVPEGTQNYYIALVVNEIGRNKAGLQTTADDTLNMEIVQVRGQSILAAGSIDMDGIGGLTSANSNAIAVVPVRVADINSVSSHGGVSVASSLQNGLNRVAIVEVANDNHSTTQTSDGSAVETELTSMELTLDTDIDTLNGIQISQVGSTATPVAGHTTFTKVNAGDNITFVFAGDNQVGTTIVVNGVTLDAAALLADDAAEIDALVADCVGSEAIFTCADNDPNFVITAVEDLYITGITNAANVTPSVVATTGAVYFPMVEFTSDANLLDAGETAYYLIEVDVLKDAANDNDDFVTISFDNFTSSSLVYRSTDSTNNEHVRNLRLSKSRLSIDTLSE
jgi:hypothetical protein